MSCGDWLERISEAVDGTLPEADREVFEGHLAGCPECRGRLLSMRAVKHAVARLPSRETPPGAVRARIKSLPLQVGGQRRIVGLGWAVTVLVLLSAAWAALLLRHREALPSADLAQALVDDHLRSVPEAMPAEVTTSDPQQAARFFVGRVPFPPAAARLPGSRLIGGRLCKLDGKRVELLFYGSGGRTFSLYAFGDELDVTGCREAHGHWVCGRRLGDLTLLLVGKASGDELRRLLDEATLVRAE
jgi:anti-sigma factor RsiW